MIWTFILTALKKFWYIPVILILLFVCCIAFDLYQKNKHIKQVYMNNTAQLLRAASNEVQHVKAKRQMYQHAIDSLSAELKVKPKHITSIHTIKGEYRVDTVVRVDTFYHDNGVMFTGFEYSDNCMTISYNDTNLTAQCNYDFNIVGYKVRPKNWFINFKWNKNKWENKINIVTPCDSIIYKKNLIFEVWK